jgi:hypothetical protein
MTIPKFRAWHKESKTMRNVQLINFFHEYVFVASFKSFDDLRNRNTIGEWKFHEIELMQYTGLPDKHGKDGCESDICKAPNGLIFQIVWDKERVRFRFKDHLFNISDEFKSMEIIGNIYENPELLNNANDSSSV